MIICSIGTDKPHVNMKCPHLQRNIADGGLTSALGDLYPFQIGGNVVSGGPLSYEERMKWFHEARFGIFVHWGLYSVLGRGEWVMNIEHIPADEYALLAKKFNPKKFDADAWAALAKRAGAKYMVLTARHHDGFCLFDSKVSDFTSVKTAAKRDFVAEYVKALRKVGLKAGLYYSWMDWRFPGCQDHKANPESAKAMVAQAHAQIRELMTNYGKIDILWYDGEWIPGMEGDESIAEFWESRKVNAIVRELQPHIIINNRCGLKEDIDTPEQAVKASEPGRAWESCMTMGDSKGWGYVHNSPNFKPVAELIQNLAKAAAGGGNFLLNMGPKPDGTIRREEVTRLTAIGDWLEANGESVYGSRRTRPRDGASFDNGMIGGMAFHGGYYYMHVFRWPRQGEISLWGAGADRIKSATVLATGQKATIVPGTNGRVFLKGLPKAPPNPYDSVIKIAIS